MIYIVVYRTATHIGFRTYDSEAEAREHVSRSPGYYAQLYACANPDGFGYAEAKDLYTHGTDALAPAWGIREIDLEPNE